MTLADQECSLFASGQFSDVFVTLDIASGLEVPKLHKGILSKCDFVRQVFKDDPKVRSPYLVTSKETDRP